MKKKKKPDAKPSEDEEAHPWLINYNKRQDPRYHIEQLKRIAMTLEDNLGFVSVVTLINTIFIVILTFGALITGAIGVSSALSDSLLGLVKSTLHK